MRPQGWGLGAVLVGFSHFKLQLFENLEFFWEPGRENWAGIPPLEWELWEWWELPWLGHP